MKSLLAKHKIGKKSDAGNNTWALLVKEAKEHKALRAASRVFRSNPEKADRYVSLLLADICKKKLETDRKADGQLQEEEDDKSSEGSGSDEGDKGGRSGTAKTQGTKRKPTSTPEQRDAKRPNTSELKGDELRSNHEVLTYITFY